MVTPIPSISTPSRWKNLNGKSNPKSSSAITPLLCSPSEWHLDDSGERPSYVSLHLYRTLLIRIHSDQIKSYYRILFISDESEEHAPSGGEIFFFFLNKKLTESTLNVIIPQRTRVHLPPR